jgi:hypothetical protein
MARIADQYGIPDHFYAIMLMGTFLHERGSDACDEIIAKMKV